MTLITHKYVPLTKLTTPDDQMIMYGRILKKCVYLEQSQHNVVKDMIYTHAPVGYIA